MRHWRCKVCGHIFAGIDSPRVCPHCNAPQEMFYTVQDEQEHAHVNTENKITVSDQIEVQPFFGNFEHIAPYIYTIPAGEILHIHNHPQEEMFYVMKGNVTFIIGDHTFNAKPGDALQAKKEIAHSIENNGSKAAVVLVVKGPK